MLNIVVCIKQVPMVTELPWNEKTGTLRRDLAAAMHEVEEEEQGGRSPWTETASEQPAPENGSSTRASSG